MSNYSLVVFDMAGTTVRDKGNVAESFMKALAQHNITVPLEEVNKVMGWRKKEAIKILLQKFHTVDEALIETLHEQFTQNMIDFYKTDETLQPLPFAEDVFATLRHQNIKVALNTGFTRAITDVLLEQLNWQNGNMVDDVIASDEVQEGRPHPFMINELMKRHNITDAATVAKVGDTEVDILEGKNAGCGLVIGITTGAYTRDALQPYQPDKIIDSLHELPSLIL
ncbi:HAD hydrolase-like protein [Lacibacter sp. MH-610]|uniref:HAD hydrolase-like protein n=1 Tax=Lacibacter sp. MH-610 TaxID=3020883 RepID=UPI003891ED46